MTVRETRQKPLPQLSGKRATVTVGIHGDDGSDPHAHATFEADGALTPDSDLTVSEVGSFHEFGLGVPQRSFIRGWFDEAVEENRALIASQLKLAILGKLTLEAALERIALKMEASIKKRIAARGNGAYPGLAASTIKRKGSSVPLIDTGQLRAAIRGRFQLG